MLISSKENHVILTNYSLIITCLTVNFLLLLGNSVVGFVIASHLYQDTAKISNMGILYLLQLLPGMIIKMFSGILIDRINNKKLVIIVSDILCVINILYLLNTYVSHNITSYSMYIFVSIFSILSSIKAVATTVLITPHTATQSRAKVNALIDVSQVLPRLVGPFIGSYLYVHNISVIFIVDCVGHILSAMTFLFFAKVKQIKENHKKLYSFKDYIVICKSTKEIVYATTFLSLLEFQSCLLGIYIYPILLNILPVDKTGIALSIIGLGTIIGGLLFTLLPQRDLYKKRRILYYLILQALFLCCFSMFKELRIQIIFLLLFFAFTPVIRGNCNAMIQNAVPSQYLGGIIALNNFTLQLVACMTFVIGGYAADILTNILTINAYNSISNSNTAMYILINLSSVITGSISVILIFKKFLRINLK
jgi:MFS family permease